ncbi:conjugative transposon protein TraM [uncultured Bacteroides sp.]|uniref:conjugative transposon protein TraM n=1 Tax=uncultured Bacteroides sp. TaxID=162156 RepID=UPI0026092C51|nr:conjugative transposon protein TraM [uncultured Bacteroides sp.]
MEQTKNEPKNENKAAPDNGKPKKERKPLTEAQRLKHQKMIVLPAMVLVFIGAMWLIFASSSDKEQQPGTGGYNIEMPDADKANCQIIGDKAKAYEQGAMEERQENRSRAMQELGDMFDRKVAETDGGRDFDLANPGGSEEAEKSAPKTIRSSAAAYRDLNATLGNFYEQPKKDNADVLLSQGEKMDELLERIASLETELESEKGKASAMDDQVALMEKSYELAAKYMGGQNGTQPPVGQAAEPYPVQKAGKNTAAPVRQVAHHVVSSLSQPMSNAEFVASFSQNRNRSFNTAVGITTVSDKNTISACVYGAQSVTDGQAVKLRLLEPMAVADKIIPRNAVVVGTAKIQGERLDIEITSLEYAGTIIPVELEVYDTDGQPGIFIPNSMEMNAVREVAANMGGSLGSNINISTNAGAQLASDLGKGLIQGTSQYIAKKMRTVKVHLKAGYKVMLYQDRN